MKPSFPSVALTTFLLLACSSSSGTSEPIAALPFGDASVPSDASRSARDASLANDVGSPIAAADANLLAPGDLATVRWSVGAPLQTARDHHATFMVTTTAGRFLYVAGGRKFGVGVANSVERAQVNAADGSLSPWVEAGRLPSAAGGSAVAQEGRTVLLIGGTEQGRSSTKVLVGTVDDAGNLSLTTGPSLAVARFHGTAAVAGKYVYVFGGFPDNRDFVGTDVIERAEIADGRVGTWSAVGNLPARYTHQATVAYGDSIYLVSGTTTTIDGSVIQQTSKILRARVASDGGLSAWENAGTLPQGRSTHAATVSGSQLLVAGGADTNNTRAYDDLFVARFSSDGLLSPFRVLGHEPVARMHLHQTPIFDNHLYLVGGMSHDSAGAGRSEQRVDIATLE